MVPQMPQKNGKWKMENGKWEMEPELLYLTRISNSTPEVKVIFAS